MPKHECCDELSITYFELTGHRCPARINPRHAYRCNGPGLTVYEIKHRLRRDVRLVHCIREATIRPGQPPQLQLRTTLGDIIPYGPLAPGIYTGSFDQLR